MILHFILFTFINFYLFFIFCIVKIDSKNILFVKAFGNIGWQISVSSTNSDCQTSEILLSVNVLEWASKDWLECSGPYESDCISWNIGYVLNSDKSCVKYVSFIPLFSNRLFWIWGFIAMIVTIFYVFLSLKFGKLMLEPAMHLQTLMMLVLSTDCVNENWIEYISWIQYFKFDFAFLNVYWLNNLMQWTPSSDRFSNARIYWQETVINYLNLIVFVVLVLVTIAIIKLLKSNILSQLAQWISIQPESILWLCWCIVMPFFCINIYNDLTTFRHHLKLSLLSSLILIMICIYCVLKRSSFMSNVTIQKINPYNSLTYIYLSLTIRIPIVAIYLSQVQMLSFLLMMLIFIMHSSLLFALIKFSIKLPLQQNFNRATEILWISIMHLVIMIVAVEKVSFCNQICVVFKWILERVHSITKSITWNQFGVSLCIIDDDNVFVLLSYWSCKIIILNTDEPEKTKKKLRKNQKKLRFVLLKY